jgi:ankyrin repeat protein
MYFYLKYFFFQKDADYKIINMIKAKDSGGSTPLHWAAYSSAEDILLYLIHLNIYQSENERLEFINQADKQGFTALHLSVSSKSIRIVMKLLQSGANAEIIDKKGNTPLKLAMNKNLKDIAEVLKNNKNCELCNVKAPVKQIKKSIKNIIYVFIAQTITTSFIFISVLAIAFNTSSYEKEKFVFYDILFVIYIASLFTFFLLYISLLWMDPGVIRAKSLTYLDKKIDKGTELNKYCYECYVEKTKDSRHCFICHKCYDNFDHHCYWINKCVARNNFILFIIFLFNTSVYLLIAFFVSILGLINVGLLNSESFDIRDFCREHVWLKFFNLNEACVVIYNNKFNLHLVLNIILIFVILLFLIPECFLLFLHINVIVTNYKNDKINKKNKYIINESTLINDNDNSFHIFRSN